MTEQANATGSTDPPDGSNGAGRARRLTAWRRGRSETGGIPAVSAGSLPAALAEERVTETGEIQARRYGPDGRVIQSSAPGSEQDWVSSTRAEADRARHSESAMATWTPGAGLPELDVDGAASPSLVRPYARTGGRTKPVRDLSLEALVRTSVSGKEASASPWLSPEHSSIIQLCNGTASVAEIAAKLSVPLGVARVIIADMVDLGLVEVMKTSASEGDERDPDFLRRVLSGLQRL